MTSAVVELWQWAKVNLWMLQNFSECLPSRHASSRLDKIFSVIYLPYDDCAIVRPIDRRRKGDRFTFLRQLIYVIVTKRKIVKHVDKIVDHHCLQLIHIYCYDQSLDSKYLHHHFHIISWLTCKFLTFKKC